jgi:hypothetical protein
MIAQTSAGLALTAAAWSRPQRMLASSLALVAAVWWAVLLPMQQSLLGDFGIPTSAGCVPWCLRAYPSRPHAFQVMMAQAKCNMAT